MRPTVARVVLAAAAGRTNTAIAADLRVSPPTVGKWRQRFPDRRLDGLTDDPRSTTDAQCEAVVTRTLESKPADATHWSTRGMAKAAGLSRTAISRIGRAFGPKPHRAETFKLSADPYFVAKVRDVDGLYLSPPERAVVMTWCVGPGQEFPPKPATTAHRVPLLQPVVGSGPPGLSRW